MKGDFELAQKLVINTEIIKHLRKLYIQQKCIIEQHGSSIHPFDFLHLSYFNQVPN